MHTFFHGWRRKAGVVTLVLALAVLVAWMRSQFVTDTYDLFEYHAGSRLLVLESRSGWLLIIKFRLFPNAVGPASLVQDGGVGINYFLMITPLTLLSAFLILWKPRKRRVHIS